MALLGVAFALLSLSPDYVTGHGAFWQFPAGDDAKGEIGWFYYARDALRFPLFAIGNYHLPEGGNVLLSDSLPLFALPAKLAYLAAWPAGAEPPVYMGGWVALCFVLQVVAASRLVAALGVRAPLPHLAAVALFAYMPMLFARVGHTTLLAHFAILASLEGYVRAKREGLSRRHWIVLCALPVFALLIHPYIAAMSGILVAATILDQWRAQRLDLKRVLARLGSIAAAAAFVIWIGGFSGATETNFGDYGTYSLNLLSPLVPFPGTTSGNWLHTETPNIPGLFQGEGGAYLGAGVMLLCLCAIPALKDWRSNIERHAVLLGILLAVLVFAVSNRVGLGSHELVHVPLPDRLISLLSEFRGSGRFVWIAVYALVAALVVAVTHRYRARTAMLILSAAAVLQILDVAPLQAGVRAFSATPPQPTIRRDAWTTLIASHQSLFQFPSFECGSVFGNGVPGTRSRELEIDWLAAKLGKPTNSAYLARFTKNCERERATASIGPVEPGVLYLYRSSEDIGDFLQQNRVDTRRCGYLDDVVVCSADQDLSSLR